MKQISKYSVMFTLLFSTSFALATVNPPTAPAANNAEPVSSGVIAPAVPTTPAATTTNSTSANAMPQLNRVSAPALPTIIPTQPNLNAKAYILIDAGSGEMLAANNPDQRLPPASLTKMMTSYVISRAIKEGRIHMDDQVRISEKAWRTQGSKMFIRVGNNVAVRDLMQGIIVDSGNDACVAMAEYVAGSEDAFVGLMNAEAARLGMTNTHFMDSTGMPNPDHYSSARDLAILARALIIDFPEDYQWYSQKWFSYNNIKQPNRNRLLWRDAAVDGVKTGHTDEAGFCLVASAQHNGMRLISVLMGAPNDATRADDSERLLNYGFRFFEVHKVYPANTKLAEVRIWRGATAKISAGVRNDLYISVAPGQYSQVKVTMQLNNPLIAPIAEGQSVGTLILSLQNKPIKTVPIVAFESSSTGGILTRISDGMSLWFKNFFNSH